MPPWGSRSRRGFPIGCTVRLGFPEADACLERKMRSATASSSPAHASSMPSCRLGLPGCRQRYTRPPGDFKASADHFSGPHCTHLKAGCSSTASIIVMLAGSASPATSNVTAPVLGEPARRATASTAIGESAWWRMSGPPPPAPLCTASKQRVLDHARCPGGRHLGSATSAPLHNSTRSGRVGMPRAAITRRARAKIGPGCDRGKICSRRHRIGR
mmetsp:Transcript_19360/g.53158  ORF Transcript_19360/g.53158 Transcript_19360/m.53158 type:complete len:215 (-) Transcript_19360:17-661(-)